MKNTITILSLLALASFASAGTINLTFIDNSDNEKGFNVERCEVDSQEDFAVIGTVWPDDVTTSGVSRKYVDRTALIGVEYVYRVNAHNEFGFSGYTNEAVGVARGGPKSPTSLDAGEAKVLSYDTDANGNPTFNYVE